MPPQKGPFWREEARAKEEEDKGLCQRRGEGGQDSLAVGLVGPLRKPAIPGGPHSFQGHLSGINREQD